MVLHLGIINFGQLLFLILKTLCGDSIVHYAVVDKARAREVHRRYGGGGGSAPRRYCLMRRKNAPTTRDVGGTI